MRALSSAFTPYGWAMSTAEAAASAGVPPEQVLRFDGNTPPEPPAYAQPDIVARALAEIQRYPHGGFPALLDAIAEYVGVTADRIVLGAGADDLILLTLRSFAGPGDVVRVADEPTYPLFRIGTWLAGAEVGDASPAVTICCRPHNPTGALVPLPHNRPLIVDEAYAEFAAGETAIGLDDVVVIRTFSKAFGLAAARVGYAVAGADLAAELRQRQDPLPISTLSAALALAGLAAPPDVSATIEERERLASGLRSVGLDPLPSHTNFVYVPMTGARETYERLLGRGLVVRPYDNAIRITVHTPTANDRLLAALEQRDG